VQSARASNPQGAFNDTHHYRLTLRGLSLNGVGATGGTNGIVFNSGNSLTITDCVAQDFAQSGSSQTTGNGILLQPSSHATSFAITNTIASNNGWSGISYVPQSSTTIGMIDHVVATNNQVGIEINTIGGGGSLSVAISNSFASNNGLFGIYVDNFDLLTVSIDNASVNGNGVGIEAMDSSKVLLGRSVIAGNGTGVVNDTSPNSFYSFGDNRINGNNNDGYMSLSTSFSTH
jgi:hypothetical protein